MAMAMVMILLMLNLGFGPVRVTGSSINVSSILTPSVFDEFFSMHSSPDCPSKGFYTLSSFLEAASAFPDFATSSSLSDSKRELAAFCGFASGVTTGGCYVNATNTSFVGCLDSPLWECAPGKKYFGRGPLQVTWNTNYGPAGKAIGFDGINNPDLVGTDAVISFKVSLWFWMTVQPSESFSCHEAILTPDLGYVEVVKIMTGGSTDANFTQESFNIYASFCSILGVQPNVSTITPSPFSSPITSGCIGSLCSTRLKVLGLVLPLFLGAVILAVLICTGFYQCKRADRFKKQSKQSYERLHTLTEAPVSFHYTTLAVATKGFTTMVGKGAFGRVYKGLLSKGQSIAVKVLEDTAYSEEQFVGEIQTVGKLNHVNLVRLVGFCIDKTRRILVYEFIPNKSLDYYLFQKWNEEEQAKLIWKQRYDIALGVARGLTYIHEQCRHKVIHRDLKPQNILLDEEFFPKIADFGLAKPMVKGQSVVMTWLKGTPGYVAPEFWVDGWAPLSSKSDVYSYGMVVFELVAGRKNVNESLPPSQVYLPELAFNNMLSLDSILEPSIVHEANLEEVQTLILVALWCIQEDPAQRPSMSRVVQYLEGVVDVPNDPPQPFRRLVLSSECNYKESSDGFSKLSVASYASNVLSTR